MEKPLIFTTKGNVPEDTLEYTQEWENHISWEVTLHVEDGNFKPTVKPGGYVVFIERYRDKESSEIVKENRHVCVFKGDKIDQEQGSLG